MADNVKCRPLDSSDCHFGACQSIDFLLRTSHVTSNNLLTHKLQSRCYCKQRGRKRTKWNDIKISREEAGLGRSAAYVYLGVAWFESRPAILTDISWFPSVPPGKCRDGIPIKLRPFLSKFVPIHLLSFHP